MKTAGLKRSPDLHRPEGQEGKWLLWGYNSTLQPLPWFDLGAFETQDEASDVAQKVNLEFRNGEDDQLFLVMPNGRQYRLA